MQEEKFCQYHHLIKLKTLAFTDRLNMIKQNGILLKK